MDIITLALAKKFTKDTAHQFGAVKGANAKIYNQKKTEEGNIELTFEWKNDADEKKYTTITIEKGIDVKSGYIDEDSHLIIVLSDDTEIDCGEINCESTLQEDLTATVEIGTVTTGKKYTKGTPIENIIRDMLIKTEAPKVVLSLNPVATIYDIVTEKIDSIILKAVITKKTFNVKKAEFFLDDTLIHSAEVDAAGGTLNFTFNPETPIQKTCVFKVVATDAEGNKGESKITVSFVGNSYYGVIDPDIGEPSEAQVKALSKKLKITKDYVFKNIICDYNKVCYAYPKEFGALTSIKDVENNVNYTNSFTRTILKIDGIDYYCYTLNEPTGSDGVDVTFA